MSRLAVPLHAYSGRGDPLRAPGHWLVRQLQATLARAAIQLRLWDGRELPAPPGAIGTLTVGDRRALAALVLFPDTAFGDLYMSGRVALQGDFAKIIAGLTALERPTSPSLVERLALRVTPRNGLAGARQNVHHHYDLGNRFYAQWLDPDMVYTCAWYPTRAATLAEAQRAKLDLVCRKLRLRRGERVVEAGCGWGALALHMARCYGVSVRAFNISHEQLRFARARAAEERLDHLVTFVEDDYRNVTGRYDAFVSLGMVEHVGRREFASLARTLARTVDPARGRGLLHFIGRDHPRRLNAWVRRRIFPGAYPPTLAEITAQVLEPADMSVLHVENLRQHYARTLADWRERFERLETSIDEEFGASFYRAWRLYLAGSEAAFRTGWLQLFQVLFAPTGGRADGPRDAPL